MKNKMKQLFGIILSLVLVLGMAPGMRLTTHAAETTIRCEGTSGKIDTMFPQKEINRDSREDTESQLAPNSYFIAPEGKCFTKIEVIESDYDGFEYVDGWTGWQGERAIKVKQTKSIVPSNNNKIIIDFTVDDLAIYNVTLNTNGGTVNDGNISTYTELKGATLPTNVTRNGYIFKGWYANAELTGELVTSIASDATGDKEYWAKWESDPNAGESSGGSSDSGSTSGDSSDSGNSSSGSTDSGSSSGSSSSSSSSTSTPAPTPVPYDDVVISTGSVNDITGTESATAESNPFETKIENNDNLTTLLALTDAEVAQGVNVWLDIQDMSASVPQTDKDLVQNASTNYNVGMYLDINLFKKVGDNTATKITETNGTVKASILIPESLWKAGRTFEIIRVHDGVATAIEGTYDENTHVFTFETDKFSTYALAYKDSASSNDSGTTSDSDSSNTSNSTQPTAPKTGDPNDIRVWYLLLIASLGGLGFLGLSKKKKVND